MRRTIALELVLLASCCSGQAGSAVRSIPTTPIASTGPIARGFLATPGFSWHSFATPHIRLHLSGIATSRDGELADSAESARRTILDLIGESDVENEPPLELILVETREDMERLSGRPVAGSGFPNELTVVLIAGPGFRPFFRHELTHAYVARRWGSRRAGPWIDEGLAARATGPCQGRSFDAVTSGFELDGTRPTLSALTGDFYSLPDLPSYFTAASLVDFIARRDGVPALRSLWRGQTSGVETSRPLGSETRQIEAEWLQSLAKVRPAALDTALLRRRGC